MLDYVRSLTGSQLARFYNRIYARLERSFAGGLRYGMDWATVRVCHPGYYHALQAAIQVMKERK